MRDLFLRFWSVAAVVATLASGGPALAQTESELMLGRDIANRLCAGCHRLDERESVVIEGVVVPSFSQIANVANMSRARLEALLIMPHRPMSTAPLPGSEVRALATYILSLK